MQNKKKYKILIIDDQVDILDFTSLILKEYGNFDVICAKNGKDGIEMAIKEQPDFILLDAWMPDINGHEVCARIKNHKDTQHIKIAMFTAAVNDKEKLESKKNSVDAFIEKPFNPDDLIKTINDKLGNIPL
ncbi:response regulator [Candidatus Poribacteria bacterium]|nr:response regulator [Candidatus Poribacteria bacterium]